MKRIEKYTVFRIIVFLVVIASVLVSVFILLKIKYIARIKQARLKDYADLLDVKLNEGGYLKCNIHEMVTGTYADKPVRWVSNSQGFKNEKGFSRKPKPGVLRIMYIGDSFVMAYRLNHQDSSGYLIEKIIRNNLNRSGFNDVEVMVAGAYDPYFALEYFKKYGEKYSPHMVVLGICLANDISGAGFREYCLKQKNEINLGAEYLLQQAYDDSFGKVNLPVEAYNKAPQYFVRSFSDTFLQPGFYYQPLQPEAEELFSDFEKALKEMHGYTRAKGIDFLALVFPLKEQIYTQLWVQLAQKFDLNLNKFDLLYPNKRIADFCRLEGIDAFDLTVPFLQKAASEPDFLYIEGTDIHWNSKGNALAAQVISYLILKKLNKKQK